MKTPEKLALLIPVFSAVAFMTQGIFPALAEMRSVTATGEYRMGDNDTRTDAKRLALLDAKRLALEQAGVYIESITEVRNLDLTKEEIRAYTAGIVEVVEQTTRTVMEGDSTVVRVDVMAKIDTDVVTQQIETLRQNQDVKSKLLEAEFRAYVLQKELEAKTQELASAKSNASVNALARQRQQLLTHADVDSLITRANAVLAGQGYSLNVGSSTPESRKYARSLLEQALAYDPENVDAQRLLGFVQFEEGRHEEAISTFRKITKKEPLSVHTHMNLGKVLEATRDWSGAIREYHTAIKLDPTHAEAHTSLGRALTWTALMIETKENASSEELEQMRDKRQKLNERAVTELREATRLAPRNAAYHYELGEALYLLADSRGVLRFGLKDEERKRRIAAQKRDREEGLAELRQAIALDPLNSEFYRALGIRLQEGEEAKEAYRAAARLNPRDGRSRTDLGTLLMNEGDRKGALTEFLAAVRVDPHNVNAHMRLGYMFEKEGRLDKAIESYRAAVSIGEVPYGEGYRLSYRVDSLTDALVLAGKRKDAAQIIRDYLKSNPDIEAFYGKGFRDKLVNLERE